MLGSPYMCVQTPGIDRRVCAEISRRVNETTAETVRTQQKAVRRRLTATNRIAQPNFFCQGLGNPVGIQDEAARPISRFFSRLYSYG
jgi:hypothetical protein